MCSLLKCGENRLKYRMTAIFWVFFSTICLFLSGCTRTFDFSPSKIMKSEIPDPDMVARGYVGPSVCAECHMDIYRDYRATAHPFKIRPAEEAHIVGMALPDGYTWDGISYVVGGRRWKIRYLDKDGYIITRTGKSRDIEGNNQYNFYTGDWSDYHPGEVKVYDCGRCHTTGYSSKGHQDGLEGIVGSWALPGITCEECHGPGRDHVESAGEGNIIRDTAAAACGRCHIRGDKNTIPADSGFIQHHEQYNEILAGPHSSMDCVECHNPHKPLKSAIIKECADCHPVVAEAFRGSRMEKLGKTCEDCHMPMASKSAVSPMRWQGDVKTHLFRINIDPDAEMFTDDGSYANGYLTLEFSCLKCHLDQSVEWAARHAENVHTLGR